MLGIEVGSEHMKTMHTSCSMQADSSVSAVPALGHCTTLTMMSCHAGLAACQDEPGGRRPHLPHGELLLGRLQHASAHSPPARRS